MSDDCEVETLVYELTFSNYAHLRRHKLNNSLQVISKTSSITIY